MYIPEFVCGIAFTVIAELFILILWAMIGSENKNRKGDGE